jgi:putative two-component system hydrogenase maturation factor HypX/HoxX
MRLLFLTHAFNSLTQRLYVECTRWGHEVSVEFDIHDRVTEEAVALWRPDLVIAPYLRRPIPATVWRRVPCRGRLYPAAAGRPPRARRR